VTSIPGISPDTRAASVEPAAVAAVDPETGYRVAVRELCEFTAKAGDLDLRFTPSPTAQEGIAGHRTVAARRGPQDQSGGAVGGGFHEPRIWGRAGGYGGGLDQPGEDKA